VYYTSLESYEKYDSNDTFFMYIGALITENACFENFSHYGMLGTPANLFGLFVGGCALPHHLFLPPTNAPNKRPYAPQSKEIRDSTSVPKASGVQR